MREIHDKDELYYEVHGTGDHVIVLIHGFLSSSSYWKRVRPGLVDAGYKVISIDLLGFGNATKPKDSNYSYNDQIEYIDLIINHLKLSQEFNLIGHSMGALIAARYAVMHPNKLKSLVLFHPPLYVDTAEASQALKNTSVFYRYLLGSKYRNIAWKMIRYLLPDIIANHTNDARERSLKNIVTKAELFDDLVRIKIKTILLVGLKDRPIYLHNLSNNTVSSSVEVIIKNVDHHSPIKKPLLAQGIILDFIRSSKYIH